MYGNNQHINITPMNSASSMPCCSMSLGSSSTVRDEGMPQVRQRARSLAQTFLATYYADDCSELLSSGVPQDIIDNVLQRVARTAVEVHMANRVDTTEDGVLAIEEGLSDVMVSTGGVSAASSRVSDALAAQPSRTVIPPTGVRLFTNDDLFDLVDVLQLLMDKEVRKMQAALDAAQGPFQRREDGQQNDPKTQRYVDSGNATGSAAAGGVKACPSQLAAPVAAAPVCADNSSSPVSSPDFDAHVAPMASADTLIDDVVESQKQRAELLEPSPVAAEFAAPVGCPENGNNESPARFRRNSCAAAVLPQIPLVSAYDKPVELDVVSHPHCRRKPSVESGEYDENAADKMYMYGTEMLVPECAGQFADLTEKTSGAPFPMLSVEGALKSPARSRATQQLRKFMVVPPPLETAALTSGVACASGDTEDTPEIGNNRSPARRRSINASPAVQKNTASEDKMFVQRLIEIEEETQVREALKGVSAQIIAQSTENTQMDMSDECSDNSTNERGNNRSPARARSSLFVGMPLKEVFKDEQESTWNHEREGITLLGKPLSERH